MRICLVSSSFSRYFMVVNFLHMGLVKKMGEKLKCLYPQLMQMERRSKSVNTKKHTKQAMYLLDIIMKKIINFFSISFIYGVFSDIKNSNIVYIQYLYHYTVLFSLFYSFLLRKKIIICPRGSFSEYTFKNKKSIWKKIWLFLFVKPISKKVFWQASSYLEKKDILSYFPNAM